MDHNNAVYGVDVAKRNLVTAGYELQTPVVVANLPESIAAWLAQLPRGATVAMEACSGQVFSDTSIGCLAADLCS
jgi:hypothetical protein